MNIAGWSIMIVSVASILGLCGFCVLRVMSMPAEVVEEHLKAPLDIDTHDLDS
ncbi:MAG: hypothetical protein JNK76_14820 [Planctomycetales bacterium]|nr:hypothetical protein [Planctomycetales bacterium]MBN8627261.1 hypothetical protein [Planctomycetota bacterium]